MVISQDDPGVSCQLSGRVLGGDRQPLVGAEVTALGMDGIRRGHGSAGRDGVFRIAHLPPGVTTLVVVGERHAPRTIVVAVPAVPRWDLASIDLAPRNRGILPEPGTYVIDTAHSSVRARSQHLGFGGISGGFLDFSGTIVVREDLEDSWVNVQIQAASIDTGNAQRDEHLRSADFLDVERFPVMAYTSSRVSQDGDRWRVGGFLKLHGVSRLVDLHVTYLGGGPDPWGGTRAAFTATARLTRDAFEMNWNQFMASGIQMVGTTLAVTIEIEAVLQ